MATNESDFKVEFRKALQKHYGHTTEVWTSNDMFRSGLPDFHATWNAKYFGIEAKYVTKLPARDLSLVLKHEISAGQYNHLKRIHETGCHGVILVGLPDIAVAIPIQSLVSTKTDSAIVTNIQLHYLKKFKEDGFGFVKVRGEWQVGGFFERLSEVK